MKMPQGKNGENTDFKCDLVLCRNKLAFEMNFKVWRRMEISKISWTEHAYQMRC